MDDVIDRDGARAPRPELLIVLKFLAATSPWRDVTDRTQDLADLIRVYTARWAANSTAPQPWSTRRWRTRARAAAHVEHAAAGHGRGFERLKPYLTGDEPTTSYREAAADLGLTESAVKTAVHR